MSESHPIILLSGDRVAFTQHLVTFGLLNVWIFSLKEYKAAVQRKEEIMIFTIHLCVIYLHKSVLGEGAPQCDARPMHWSRWAEV